MEKHVRISTSYFMKDMLKPHHGEKIIEIISKLLARIPGILKHILLHLTSLTTSRKQANRGRPHGVTSPKVGGSLLSISRLNSTMLLFSLGVPGSPK